MLSVARAMKRALYRESERSTHTNLLTPKMRDREQEWANRAKEEEKNQHTTMNKYMFMYTTSSETANKMDFIVFVCIGQRRTALRISMR